MKTKKILLPFTLFSLPIVSLPFITSCGSSYSDYSQMLWTYDKEKINNEKQNWQSFNSETISKEKLIKVIKGNGTYLDYITKDALNQGWFEKIEFENKDNKPGKLIIKLFSSKTIENSEGKKMNCPYRLPNGSLEWKI